MHGKIRHQAEKHFKYLYIVVIADILVFGRGIRTWLPNI